MVQKQTNQKQLKKKQRMVKFQKQIIQQTLKQSMEKLLQPQNQ